MFLTKDMRYGYSSYLVTFLLRCTCSTICDGNSKPSAHRRHCARQLSARYRQTTVKKPGSDEKFRLVSNLNFISKVLEKKVLSQLSKHLTVCNLEIVLLSAYKVYQCPETSLVKVTSDILVYLHKKKV